VRHISMLKGSILSVDDMMVVFGYFEDEKLNFGYRLQIGA
jgi:hypothetical protein